MRNIVKIPDYLDKVLSVLYQNGFDAYLVGGCVRDSLLSKIPSDYEKTN